MFIFAVVLALGIFSAGSIDRHNYAAKITAPPVEQGK